MIFWTQLSYFPVLVEVNTRDGNQVNFYIYGAGIERVKYLEIKVDLQLVGGQQVAVLI